jgi:hypothetical protein
MSADLKEVKRKAMVMRMIWYRTRSRVTEEYIIGRNACLLDIRRDIEFLRRQNKGAPANIQDVHVVLGECVDKEETLKADLEMKRQMIIEYIAEEQAHMEKYRIAQAEYDAVEAEGHVLEWLTGKVREHQALLWRD